MSLGSVPRRTVRGPHHGWVLVRYSGTGPDGAAVADVLEVDDVSFTGLDVVAELRELVAQRTGLADVVLVAVQR